MLHHFFHSNPHSSHNRKKEYDFGPADAPPIGVGGYSHVVKASWKAKGGMPVAVKIVRKEAIKDDSEYLKVISTGFDRIRDNENICYALDWFASSHKYYLIFPLLTGGELLERLNTRGRFTEDATKRIIYRILDTLAFIHKHGIIHRDIKPDNFIYRTPEAAIDDVVMIDFGISKILDEESEDDPKNQIEVAGTPGYAAPEVFSRTGYGKNQDVFGVGIICYNLLSSSSPWKSQSYVDLIRETITCQIEFPEKPFTGVSQEAKDFIQYLTLPDPHARPSAKETLSHPWLQAGYTAGAPLQPASETHHSDTIDADRVPLQRPATLKPEMMVARQMTAQGMEGL